MDIVEKRMNHCCAALDHERVDGEPDNEDFENVLNVQFSRGVTRAFDNVASDIT